LRPAGVGSAGVQDGFHQREFGSAIAQAGAADDIAHHEHVGLEFDLVGAISFDQLDTQGAQLVAHRRVDAGVAAGDAVAGLARQRRQPAHEGSANAQDMDVHG